MMFIQPTKFIVTGESKPAKRLKRCTKGELKTIVEKELEISSSYQKKTRGEPKNFRTVDTSPSNTHYIRKMAVHAIVRCKSDNSHRLPEEQMLGAFSGFMNSISDAEDRSKAYYHVTLPKGPSKKVVYTLMEKAIAAADCKKMPFIQFVGINQCTP